VLGMLFSLADQVLIAGIVGLLASLPHLAKSRPRITRPLLTITMIAICAFLVHSLSVKRISSTNDMVTEINGGSVGERSFHFRYGVSLLEAHPEASIFGIGPGRYGEYASETGAFPDSVNVQTSELELLVEWGVIGLAAWVALLACLAAREWEIHGILGLGLLLGIIIADSFQANWKHEAAFLAIAVLCRRPFAVAHVESPGLQRTIGVTYG
jgi:O-antigen ligase